MLSNDKKTVVFIDVDDPKLGGTDASDTDALARHVRELHDRGLVLYCWSSSGADDCRDLAKQLGIVDCFVGFLPKPDVMIDEKHPSEWGNLRWLHRGEAPSVTTQGY